MPSPEQRSVFVVIDAAQDRPLALERILWLIKHQKEAGDTDVEFTLKVFLGVDSDNSDTSADNPGMFREASWFREKVLDPLESCGVDFTVELSWSTDWYGAIIKKMEVSQPAILILPLISMPRESDRVFNESIWRLMRTATCPVLVVRPGAREDRAVVLAAVNFQSHKPDYQQMNEDLIARSKWLADIANADVHVVNAYSDSLNYPDRAQLAASTGLESSKIHVHAGDPDDVISNVAAEIDADLVVIGARNRGSRWRGNTSDRIITKVNCDILAVN